VSRNLAYHTLFYFDDLVQPGTGQLTEAQREWLSARLPEADYVRGGAYRNKFGELVTWGRHRGRPDGARSDVARRVTQ